MLIPRFIVPPRTRRKRTPQTRGVPSIQQLEARELMAVDATFVSGTLSITMTDGDDVVLSAASGAVTVNGQAPSGGAVQASDVYEIHVAGSDGANEIDLRGVSLSAFSSLTQVIVDAGGGDDRVWGSEAANEIDGGAGNDTLVGGLGNDTLIGGLGVDELEGGEGDDSLQGGAGDDTYRFARVSTSINLGVDTIVEATGIGQDGLDFSEFGAGVAVDLSAAGQSSPLVIATGKLSLHVSAGGIEAVYGSSFADALVGDAFNNQLIGRGGNDSLAGGAGFDFLIGDEGDDQISGSQEEDLVLGGQGSDQLNGQPLNDRPIGIDDEYTTNEDTPFEVEAPQGLLANDVETENDVVTAHLVAAPRNGVVSINPDGSFFYTPNADFIGVDRFIYVGHDGTSDGLRAVVTINVAPVNDPPVGVTDTYVVDEDATLTVPASQGLLANDSDVDGDPGDEIIVANVLPGTLSVILDVGRSEYALPVGPFNIALGDVNNDSLTDVIVLSLIDGDVTAFLGNGDGTLTQAASFLGNGNLSIGITMADVNNDGDLDLLTSELGEGVAGGLLSVRLGAGTGSFGEATFHSVGAGAMNLVAVDFDDDGWVDVISAASGEGRIHILWGDAEGEFEDHDYVTVTDGAAFVVAEDLDGDGFRDLAVSGGGSGKLTFFLGDGSRTLVASSTLQVGDSAFFMTGSDIDGDGDIDFGVSDQVAGLVRILANDGEGEFTANGEYDVPSVFALGFADVTGDSHKDLLATSLDLELLGSYPGGLRVWAGVGGGIFSEEYTDLDAGESPAVPVATDLDNQPLSVELIEGPLNGSLTLSADGAFVYTPDANFFGQDRFIYVVSDGTTTSLPTIARITVAPKADAPVANDDAYVGLAGHTLNIALPTGLLANDVDIDGDIFPEIVVPNFDSATLSVLLGVGRSEYAALIGPFYAQTGDVNRDGFVDVVVLSLMTDRTMTFLGHGDGTFTSLPVSFGPENVALAFTLADVDNDDLLDMVSSQMFGRIAVRKNLGDGQFGQVAFYDVAAGASNVEVADVDGDGHVDIVTAGAMEKKVTILWGDGTGRFDTRTDVSSLGGAESVVVADFDADDALDLVVVAGAAQSVALFRGAGSRQFEAPVSFSIGAAGGLARAGDLDADGMIDLVVACPDANRAIVLMNDGGSFTVAQSLVVPSAFALTMGDLDLDGDLDLVVASNSLDGQAGPKPLHVFTNSGAGLFVDAELVDAGSSPTTPLIVDIDRPVYSIEITQSPTHGSLTVQANGSFSYTPNSGFVGTDSFQYRLHDGSSVSNVASVEISIGATAPEIVLGLVNDTSTTGGTDSDGVTIDPSIEVSVDSGIPLLSLTARLTGQPANTAINILDRLDSSGHGVLDQAWWRSSFGSAPGVYSLTVRATNAVGVSEETFVFTLEAPTFQSLGLTNDTGASSTDRVTTDPLVSGVVVAPAWMGPLTVELMRNGSSTIEEVDVDSQGHFEVSLENPADGRVRGRFRVLATPSGFSEAIASQWRDFDFVHVVNGVVIADRHLVNDTGTSNQDNVTADPTIAGTLYTEDGPTGVGKIVIGADPTRLITIMTNEIGEFEFTPYGLSAGSVTIQMRPHRWATSPTSGYVAGNLTSISFELVTTASPPSLADIHLVRDTGASSTDRITMDVTVAGRVVDSAQIGPLRVEVFFGADDNSDLMAPVDENGYFQFSIIDPPSGLIPLKLRALRWSPATGDYQAGSMTSFDVTYDQNENRAPTIENFTLERFELVSGVMTTSEATLTGRVTNDGPVSGIQIEVDLPGGSTADATIVTDKNGYFTWTPPNLVGSDETPITIGVRAAEVNPQNGSKITSSWSTIAFFLKPTSNAAPEFEFVRLKNDLDPSPNAALASDPTIIGKVKNDGPLSGLFVEFDSFDSDGKTIVGDMVQVDETGIFEYRPSDLEPGNRTVKMRVREWSSGGLGQFIMGEWVSFSFNYDPPPVAARSLSEFRAQGITVTSPTTADPTVIGTVGAAEQGVFYAIEFDRDGDSVPDASVMADSEGKFAYRFTGLQAGETTVRARAVALNPDLSPSTRGEWRATTFTLTESDAPLPVVSDLLASNLSSSNGPTITGVLQGVGSGESASVEIDHDGDGAAEGTATRLVDGTWKYQAIGLNPGTHTFWARGKVWDDNLGDFRVGNWVSTTFTVVAPTPPSLTVSQFELVGATVGSSLPETSLPRWRGQVSGSIPLGGVRVEFEWTGDELADGATVTNAEGEFDFAPRDLPLGEIVVKAKARQWDSNTGPIVSGTQTLHFLRTAPPADSAPVITELGLKRDTGTPNDSTTSDATLEGLVVDPDGSSAGLRVEFFWTGGDFADGVAVTDGDGRFEFRPRDLELGAHTITARALSNTVDNNGSSVGSPTAITFTLVAPPSALISNLGLVNDTGASSTDAITSDPTFEGSVEGGSGENVIVTVDLNGDTVADVFLTPDEDGAFSFDPSGMIAPAGAVRTVTFTVQAGRWDNVGGLLSLGPAEALTFEYSADAVAAPTITELALFNDTGAADGQTTDPRIKGKVVFSGDVAGLRVELDMNDDGIAEAYALTDDAGDFRLTPPPSAPGAKQAKVRVSAWNPATGSRIQSGASTLSYVLLAETATYPTVTNFGPERITGSVTTSETTDSTLVGRVQGGSGSGVYSVEFDYDEDGIADASGVANADGWFRHRPAGLTPGQQTIGVRAVVRDSSGQQVNVSWTQTTFELLASTAPPTFAELFIAPNANGSTPSVITDDPVIAGRIGGDGALGGQIVEVDVDSDDEADFYAMTRFDGRFEVRVTGLSEQTSSVRLRPTRRDDTNGTTVAGAWQTVTFSIDRPTNTAPVITEIQLRDDSSAGGQGLPPAIVGKVTNDGSLALVRVEFDHGSGVVDGTASVDIQGNFEYVPVGLTAGTHAIRARAVEKNSQTGADIQGQWTELSITLASPAPPPPPAPSDEFLDAKGTYLEAIKYIAARVDYFLLGSDPHESTIDALGVGAWTVLAEESPALAALVQPSFTLTDDDAQTVIALDETFTMEHGEVLLTGSITVNFAIIVNESASTYEIFLHVESDFQIIETATRTLADREATIDTDIDGSYLLDVYVNGSLSPTQGLSFDYTGVESGGYAYEITTTETIPYVDGSTEITLTASSTDSGEISFRYQELGGASGGDQGATFLLTGGITSRRDGGVGVDGVDDPSGSELSEYSFDDTETGTQERSYRDEGQFQRVGANTIRMGTTTETVRDSSTWSGAGGGSAAIPSSGERSDSKGNDFQGGSQSYASTITQDYVDDGTRTVIGGTFNILATMESSYRFDDAGNQFDVPSSGPETRDGGSKSSSSGKTTISIHDQGSYTRDATSGTRTFTVEIDEKSIGSESVHSTASDADGSATADGVVSFSNGFVYELTDIAHYRERYDADGVLIFVDVSGTMTFSSTETSNYSSTITAKSTGSDASGSSSIQESGEATYRRSGETTYTADSESGWRERDDEAHSSVIASGTSTTTSNEGGATSSAQRMTHSSGDTTLVVYERIEFSDGPSGLTLGDAEFRTEYTVSLESSADEAGERTTTGSDASATTSSSSESIESDFSQIDEGTYGVDGEGRITVTGTLTTTQLVTRRYRSDTKEVPSGSPPAGETRTGSSMVSESGTFTTDSEVIVDYTTDGEGQTAETGAFTLIVTNESRFSGEQAESRTKPPQTGTGSTSSSSRQSWASASLIEINDEGVFTKAADEEDREGSGTRTRTTEISSRFSASSGSDSTSTSGGRTKTSGETSSSSGTEDFFREETIDYVFAGDDEDSTDGHYEQTLDSTYTFDSTSASADDPQAGSSPSVPSSSSSSNEEHGSGSSHEFEEGTLAFDAENRQSITDGVWRSRREENFSYESSETSSSGAAKGSMASGSGESLEDSGAATTINGGEGTFSENAQGTRLVDGARYTRVTITSEYESDEWSYAVSAGVTTDKSYFEEGSAESYFADDHDFSSEPGSDIVGSYIRQSSSTGSFNGHDYKDGPADDSHRVNFHSTSLSRRSETTAEYTETDEGREESGDYSFQSIVGMISDVTDISDEDDGTESHYRWTYQEVDTDQTVVDIGTFSQTAAGERSSDGTYSSIAESTSEFDTIDEKQGTGFYTKIATDGVAVSKDQERYVYSRPADGEESRAGTYSKLTRTGLRFTLEDNRATYEIDSSGKESRQDTRSGSYDRPAGGPEQEWYSFSSSAKSNSAFEYDDLGSGPDVTGTSNYSRHEMGSGVKDQDGESKQGSVTLAQSSRSQAQVASVQIVDLTKTTIGSSVVNEDGLTSQWTYREPADDDRSEEGRTRSWTSSRLIYAMTRDSASTSTANTGDRTTVKARGDTGEKETKQYTFTVDAGQRTEVGTKTKDTWEKSNYDFDNASRTTAGATTTVTTTSSRGRVDNTRSETGLLTGDPTSYSYKNDFELNYSVSRSESFQSGFTSSSMTTTTDGMERHVDSKSAHLDGVVWTGTFEKTDTESFRYDVSSSEVVSFFNTITSATNLTSFVSRAKTTTDGGSFSGPESSPTSAGTRETNFDFTMNSDFRQSGSSSGTTNRNHYKTSQTIIERDTLVYEGGGSSQETGGGSSFRSEIMKGSYETDTVNSQNRHSDFGKFENGMEETINSYTLGSLAKQGEYRVWANQQLEYDTASAALGGGEVGTGSVKTSTLDEGDYSGTTLVGRRINSQSQQDIFTYSFTTSGIGSSTTSGNTVQTVNYHSDVSYVTNVANVGGVLVGSPGSESGSFSSNLSYIDGNNFTLDVKSLFKSGTITDGATTIDISVNTSSYTHANGEVTTGETSWMTPGASPLVPSSNMSYGRFARIVAAADPYLAVTAASSALAALRGIGRGGYVCGTAMMGIAAAQGGQFAADPKAIDPEDAQKRKARLEALGKFGGLVTGAASSLWNGVKDAITEKIRPAKAFADLVEYFWNKEFLPEIERTKRDLIKQNAGINKPGFINAAAAISEDDRKLREEADLQGFYVYPLNNDPTSEGMWWGAGKLGAWGTAAGISVFLAGKGLLALGARYLPLLAAGANKNVAELGQKLDYVFGKATGSAHNIDRSRSMLSQLERIGLHDNAASRNYLQQHFDIVVNNASNIVRTQANGRVVRESLLMGPNGGVKVESIWEGLKLITVNIFGGR